MPKRTAVTVVKIRNFRTGIAEICAHRLTTSAGAQPMISPQRMLLCSMKELSTSLNGRRGGRGDGSGRGGGGGSSRDGGAAGFGGGSTVRSTTTDDPDGVTTGRTTTRSTRSVLSVSSVVSVRSVELG